MSTYLNALLALCCLLGCAVGVAVADTPAQAADDGPNVTVSAPDQAVYNATSTFEVAVTNATGDVSVEWTFPDGSNATTRQASYRFQQEGNVTVTVAVTDDTGTTTRTLDYEVYRYSSGQGDSQALPVLGMLGVVVGLMTFVVALYFKVLPWFYRNI
ncbi:PKD domain-containing protein [Haloarchaeobius sp. FL176]|uniref:PKD domain-containing protein n=1 Tax=Haloarchaeobius sp. FL176 TaxID=2967129 RepID=UPI0021483FC9|nr:PKD domain-containing protein [Haloarchaeobius sp. FL176]